MSKANPRFRRNNAPLPLLVTPAYRVQPFYLVDNQICMWTMDYIMTTSAQTAASETNIAESWEAACLTPVRDALSSDCFFYGVRVTCLTTPSRMPVTYFVVTANQPGLVVGNHLNSELAAILSKTTGVKGQHGRGRAYLPGIPTVFVSPDTNANSLNIAGIAAAEAVAIALEAGTTADSGNVAIPAVTTRATGGAAVTRGATLTGILVRPLMGIVRRRRVGSGK